MSLTDAFKTSIAHVGDLVRTSKGDLGTISGLANLQNALLHRLLTVPGTLVHRPTYGVGITLFENALSSFGQQQKLANIIQEQFAKDPRVAEVSSIAISNASDSNPALVRVNVSIKPLGYNDIVSMQFTPFGGGL